MFFQIFGGCLQICVTFLQASGGPGGGPGGPGGGPGGPGGVPGGVLYIYIYIYIYVTLENLIRTVKNCRNRKFSTKSTVWGFGHVDYRDGNLRSREK